LALQADMHMPPERAADLSCREEVLAVRRSTRLWHPPDAQPRGETWSRRTLAAAAACSAGLGLLLVAAEHEATISPEVVVTALTIGNLLILARFASLAAHSAARIGRRQMAAEHEAATRHIEVQQLIDNTPAIVCMKRLDDGRYLLVNREWERLFRVPRAEALNLTAHQVHSAKLADSLRDNDLWVAREGKTVQFEESHPNGAGGSMRAYASVKFPVRDDDGQVYAIGGISTDITERLAVEEKVRKLNADLEIRVRERTADIEASTRELDAFAYSVSHDLRAPLRSLNGFSQALLEDFSDVLDDTGKDYLRRIHRSVRTMGQMIDSLLNLSRATRAELNRRAIDLSALVGEIAAELSAADPGRQVTVKIADNLRCNGDPQLLRLVLRNLLGNARKFSAKTSCARIDVGQVDIDGEDVFFVRDNGAGFDMRYASKLFSAFQRLHSAADFEGTGVGLATVQRIVSRHGGHIFAEAEPGKGATFYFTLQTPTEGIR
jgi:PAS domain S-box-containing protein